MFTPASNDLATQASATISKGHYQIPRDKGLLPGKYRVAISSVDGRTPESGDAVPGPSGNFASRDRIPAEYNRDSKLEAEVKQGESNVFDYPIP
jgi:hypothetical protein